MLATVHYTIAVAGVVSNAAGQILLIKTEQAGWELPGGRVEPGEDLIGALRREVREEAACEVTVGRLVGLSTNTVSTGLVLFTFLCAHERGQPRAQDESLDAGWFDPDEAVQLVTHPAERARLQDALAAAHGVVYRVYGASGLGSIEPNRHHI